MDNDPKHTSHSTREFIMLNNINHCKTPPQSPDLMPIEMVWNDLKYYLTSEKKLSTKKDLIKSIKSFWQSKMNDLDYCKKKFTHMNKVIDTIIAYCGRATGL